MRRLILYLAIVVAALAAAPAAAGGTTYYVATDGDDASPGTLQAPWRTIQKAADTLTPGDTVYIRGGVYNERVRVNVSGSSAGGFITFANYANETAVIDGKGLVVASGWDALVAIEDRSYIRIQGLELRRLKTKKKNHVPVGILVWGAGEHIELSNNRIHDIKTKYRGVEGADAHGIAVYGTRAPEALREIVIDRNELYGLKLGSSEALVVNGNVEHFAITHNLVRDSNNIAIDAVGYEQVAPDEAFDRARDGTITDNVVYNIDSATNPAYQGERSAGCIYIDGGTRIVVERNVAHHGNIGIELASEHRGKATSAITVRNNFIYRNTEAGIAIGGYDKRRGRTEDCLILNNTLYDNDTSQAYGGELYVQFDTRNNIIRNNIMYAGAQGLFIANWSKKNAGNVVDNNLYFTAQGGGEWQWKNKSYTKFSAYQNATGNDTSSLYKLDPLFADLTVPDLHLLGNSPAIDFGAIVAGVGGTDVDGEVRVQGEGVDLGADEVR